MLRKLILDVLRPFLLCLPRGAGTVYRLLGGYRENRAWNQASPAITRGTDHGCRMRLDLTNRIERETYYLGRFYEWELQELLRQVLHPGDTFLDVGANIGMITLAAAARVRSEGTVLAFEPNPNAHARLSAHIDFNALSQVRIHNVALGEAAGVARLAARSDHTGTATLRPMHNPECTFEVRVDTLDAYLDQIPPHRFVFLKTDAEGFDFSVLKGARRLLARSGTLVFAEVNHAWLAELGQTAQEMFAYMNGFGYRPYSVQIRGRLLHRELTIKPLSLPGPHHWFNVLFARDSELPALRPM